MSKTLPALFAGNLTSKVLGLLREVLMAGLFGTGQVAGAYRVAQVGTMMPLNVISNESLNAVFIPVYKRLSVVSLDKALLLLWVLVVVFSVVSLFLAGMLWVWSEQWVRVLAPGFSPDAAALAVSMLRITAVGVPCYLLSALFMYLALVNDDPLPLAFKPSVQNVGLISGALLAFYYQDFSILAWGFTLSYFMFLAWVSVRLVRAKLLRMPEHWAWPGVIEVLEAFWLTFRPLLLLPLLLQGNLLAERAIASLVGLMAVSAIDYAKFITETLIFLVSMPVAFAGLSSWSLLSSEEMQAKMKGILTLLAIVGIPVSCFLALFSEQLVTLIFARGAFDAQSVQVTSQILLGLSIGLWAQVIGYVFIKGLNAQLRSRVVMLIIFISVMANISVNLILYRAYGPLALGIGKSAYGLVMLAGCILALHLVNEAVRVFLPMVAAAVGYVMFVAIVPLPSSLIGSLVLGGILSSIYWLAVICAVPTFRRALLMLRRSKRRSS